MKRHLVGGGSLLLVLLEPVLLDGGGLTSGGLAFDLNLLALVGGQLAGKVGLLGGGGGLGESELLDVLLGVAGLEGGRLVCLELAEVKVLDGVGLKGMLATGESNMRSHQCGRPERIVIGTYRGGQRRSGRCGRQGPVAERHG
jgi:hypothetical protein